MKETSNGVPPKSGTGISVVESLKRGTAELVILSLLNETSMPISEVIENMEERSKGRFSISGPHAVFYRLERFEYIHTTERKIAKDGRLRQYFQITATGKQYLRLLYREYKEINDAIYCIIGNSLEEGGISDE